MSVQKPYDASTLPPTPISPAKHGALQNPRRVCRPATGLNNPGIFPSIEAQFGIDAKKLPHSQNAREKRQDQLRVQIDVLVAQFYQMSATEMETVSFLWLFGVDPATTKKK